MDIACGTDFDSKAICQRILDHNRDAENELAAHFEPRVRTFLRVRTSDAMAVDELTQEVLLSVLCALREGRLRDPGSLPAFVYGVARNLLNSHVRTQSRQRVGPLPLGFDVPDSQAYEQEMVHTARREIENLEPVDRDILTLTVVEGCRPGEIARRIGMSADAIRQRKSRLLKKLAEKLRPLSQSRSRGPLK